MYADRLESGGRLPVKDRLNGSRLDGSGRRRQITGKRQRDDDDKWEHDLYEHNKPQMSRRKIGSADLRLKLQRKSNQQASQSGKADLRERLSGIFHPRVEIDLPKPKNAPEISKPVMKNVISEAPVSATKKVSNKVIKKSQQKAGSMDSFLQSLGLEKYSITFQAEEVDMAALVHMTDEDLKAMGIPMGPRKKILLALESKS